LWRKTYITNKKLIDVVPSRKHNSKTIFFDTEYTIIVSHIKKDNNLFLQLAELNLKQQNLLSGGNHFHDQYANATPEKQQSRAINLKYKFVSAVRNEMMDTKVWYTYLMFLRTVPCFLAATTFFITFPSTTPVAYKSWQQIVMHMK
jgi:hypothetical protein